MEDNNYNYDIKVKMKLERFISCQNEEKIELLLLFTSKYKYNIKTQ